MQVEMPGEIDASHGPCAEERFEAVYAKIAADEFVNFLGGGGLGRLAGDDGVGTGVGGGERPAALGARGRLFGHKRDLAGRAEHGGEQSRVPAGAIVGLHSQFTSHAAYKLPIDPARTRA
jgi:hypothetical protein